MYEAFWITTIIVAGLFLALSLARIVDLTFRIVAHKRAIREMDREMRDRGFEKDAHGIWRVRRDGKP